MRLTLNSRELVLHGPVLLLLDAVLVVTGQHPSVLLPVVDRPRPGLHSTLQLNCLALKHCISTGYFDILRYIIHNPLYVNICLCFSPRYICTHLDGCTERQTTRINVAKFSKVSSRYYWWLTHKGPTFVLQSQTKMCVSRIKGSIHSPCSRRPPSLPPKSSGKLQRFPRWMILCLFF